MIPSPIFKLTFVRHKNIVEKDISPGIVLKSYTEGSDGEILGPVPMKAAVDCSGIDVQDAVLLMVKGTDTETALQGAMGMIGDHTRVITLQNGIGRGGEFTSVADMISREFLADLDIPVAFGFPAGHGDTKYPLMMGTRVKLRVDQDTFTLDFTGS